MFILLLNKEALKRLIMRNSNMHIFNTLTKTPCVATCTHCYAYRYSYTLHDWTILLIVWMLLCYDVRCIYYYTYSTMYIAHTQHIHYTLIFFLKTKLLRTKYPPLIHTLYAAIHYIIIQSIYKRKKKLIFIKKTISSQPLYLLVFINKN